MESWRVGVMGIRSRLGLFVCSLVSELLLTVAGQAADRRRVATGGVSPRGQMLKQDIEIEDILMSSGSLSAQTLASGQVKIIVTTSAVVPQFNLSGGDHESDLARFNLSYRCRPA